MNRDVWPDLDLADIIAALSRPLLPPGPPSVDPALGGGDEDRPIIVPGPWQPTHHQQREVA